MIVRIDEDRVVWTSGHARFAADTNRFIKVDDPVCSFEHGRGRTGGDARRVGALIAAGHLMRAPRLRKDSDVDVLDVGARHADWHDVLRLARRRARMATDTAGVVDDLGPLHGVLADALRFNHVAPECRAI